MSFILTAGCRRQTSVMMRSVPFSTDMRIKKENRKDHQKIVFE